MPFMGAVQCASKNAPRYQHETLFIAVLISNHVARIMECSLFPALVGRSLEQST